MFQELWTVHYSRGRAADSPDSHSSGASQSSAASTLYSSDSASSAGQLFGAKTREKTDSKCVYVTSPLSSQCPILIPAVYYNTMLSILRSMAKPKLSEFEDTISKTIFAPTLNTRARVVCEDLAFPLHPCRACDSLYSQSGLEQAVGQVQCNVQDTTTYNLHETL